MLLARAERGGRVNNIMSPNGTSRHFAAAQQFGRIWSEADINHRAGFMSTRPGGRRSDLGPRQWCLPESVNPGFQ